MKKLYEYQQYSLYDMARKLGTVPSALYRLLGNTKAIEAISAKLLFGIAEMEEVDPIILWEDMKQYSLKQKYEKI